MVRTVTVVSGGLDSVALAYHLHAEGAQQHLLSIDYGQRHRNEHDYAALVARRLGLPHQVAELRAIGELLPGYSLTDNAVDVPDQHYTSPGSVNVVPNRNVILLSVAYAYAAALKADQVAIGTVAGDADTGSDCSPEFIAAFNAMERIACHGYAPPQLKVVAPFIELPKHKVITIGEALGVPWDQTWSCFKGLSTQCGVCAACHDRRSAFAKAGVPDPTSYDRG